MGTVWRDCTFEGRLEQGLVANIAGLGDFHRRTTVVEHHLLVEGIVVDSLARTVDSGFA